MDLPILLMFLRCKIVINLFTVTTYKYAKHSYSAVSCLKTKHERNYERYIQIGVSVKTSQNHQSDCDHDVVRRARSIVAHGGNLRPIL